MLVKGSIVAIVTPMKANGDLDLDALDKLVDFHVESGTKGIIAVGTTGESATLEVSEHISVIERIVKKADKKVFIFAGTGANSTKEAIYLSMAAKSAGADASLSVTPYYNKPTQEGLFQHYTQIADQVEFPQVLYNVPGRTSCDLLPETIARLAPHENILGIKEATGDLSRLEKLKKLISDKTFFLYSGDDATATDFILNGGHGNISVTANVV
ncbi:MAG: 4-hydroxy-tetrahydrodipicolinate synthase, partial [Gammaproteobacteria bacterium]